MKKKSSSLLRRYIIIIVVAVILFPISMPIVTIGFYTTTDFLWKPTPDNYNHQDIEEEWHAKADELQGASAQRIQEELTSFHERYSESSVFWVDQNGNTRDTIQVDRELPETWSSSQTVNFMKKSYGGDPFTIVAFIGEEKDQGFMVFQLPRTYIDPVINRYQDEYGVTMMVIGMAIIYGSFLIVSLLFFLKIRKRIVHVQRAMSSSEEHTIPEKIKVGKRDEIGLLQETFNEMIEQLETSRQKELEEEQLRRELIANLSHDLRTPLTTIRGQIYTLKKEVSSDKGTQAIELADEKITYVGELIENLLSYSLLSAHKYPFEKEEVEVVRLTRRCIAMWYDSLENEGMEVETSLTEETGTIHIDPKWFQRMFDNVIQNVIRHARSGKYVGICLSKNIESFTLSIQDHGPGLSEQASESKGAGIGLTIISLMAEEMNISWTMETNAKGTKVEFTIPIHTE